MRGELHLLQEDRRKYLNNPLTCYWNINDVCNKIVDLRIIIQTLPLDCLVLSETKLDKYGPDKTDKNSGGLIEFVKKGIICKRISEFELSFSEYICSELAISNTKWLCLI